MGLTPRASLLILDDEKPQMKALCDTLQSEGFVTTGFTSASEALAALRKQTFDVVLNDLMMPEMSGTEFLRAALEIDPNMVGIVMTGHGAIQTAVEAMRAGALDYILKPFRLTTVMPVLERAITVRRLRMDNIQLHQMVGIFELSTGIASAEDFDDVLQKIASAVIAQIGICGVSILLPSEDGGQLRAAVARGDGAERLEGMEIQQTSALTQWVERTADLLCNLLHDPDDETDLDVALEAPGGKLKGTLSIPMLSGGRFVGILNCRPDLPRRPLASGQVKALNVLASAGASALAAASLLEQTRAAEKRYRRLADNAADVVFRYEVLPRPRYTYVNRTIAAVTGRTPEELCSNPQVPLVHPDDRAVMQSLFRGDYPSGSTTTMRWLHRNGSVVWIEQRSILVRDSQGVLVAIEGIARDITERKQLVNHLEEALAQKTVLLQEVHHRVKNNLAVISALLGLRAESIGDERAATALLESRQRVYSMALIHESLCGVDGRSRIRIDEYSNALAKELYASFSSPAGVSIRVEAPSLELGIDQAIPCGLILNELLSNALKYAFPEGRSGEVVVSFEEGNETLSMSVEDDGAGVSADFDWEQTQSFGLQITRVLAEQIDGKLEFHRTKGTRFDLTFPYIPVRAMAISG